MSILRMDRGSVSVIEIDLWRGGLEAIGCKQKLLVNLFQPPQCIYREYR